MIKKLTQLPYWPILVAPIALFSPLIFTGKAMFWGTPALQFVPWWAWSWETLLDGHLPLWNPLVGMGAPLIANYQSALFYPPNWLYFLFYVIGGVSLMAWAQSLLVVLHLIWSGLGMAYLTRRMGLGRLAQTISGLAFSLSGYLVARSWFASINAAVAWLPWIMLFAFEASHAHRSSRSWLKLGLVIGLQLLSGHAQTTWYSLVLAAIWLGYWAWARLRGEGSGFSLSDISDLVRHEIRLGLAVLLGAALAAVQLLPTAVYLTQSQRASAVEMEFALNYSFWPWRFLGLIMPDLFGSPVRGDFWGYGNYWEDAIYIGVLPFLLALGAILRARPKRGAETTKGQLPGTVTRQRSLINLLVVLILTSFLLALGKNTPVYPWLYEHIPAFDMFQAPTRLSIWAIFSLALLSGIGAQAWHRPVKRALYWTRLGTAGAFAISFGAGLAYFALGDIQATFIRATALAGFWALGAGALSLLAPPKDESNKALTRWPTLVVLWVALDLVFSGWGLVLGIDLDFYTSPAVSQEPIDAGRIYLSEQQEYDIKYVHFLRFESFQPDLNWQDMRAAHLPNVNMLDGIPSVNNFDPLVSGRYAVWVESLGKVGEAKRETLLRSMGVSTVEKISESDEFGVLFQPLNGGSRLRWLPCAVAVDDEPQAWERVFHESYNPEDEVVLEGLGHAPTPDCFSGSGRANLAAESPNHLVIDVDATSSGWVVLSDTWYPGWKAWVDGNRVPILRANYLFRAIPVAEGEHQVILKYQPIEFYLGGMTSVCVGLALWFVNRTKKINI
jgi:hypothetical protein